MPFDFVTPDCTWPTFSIPLMVLDFVHVFLVFLCEYSVYVNYASTCLFDVSTLLTWKKCVGLIISSRLSKTARKHVRPLRTDLYSELLKGLLLI